MLKSATDFRFGTRMLYKPDKTKELYEPCLYIKSKKIDDDAFAMVLFENATKLVKVPFDTLYERW